VAVHVAQADLPAAPRISLPQPTHPASTIHPLMFTLAFAEPPGLNEPNKTPIFLEPTSIPQRIIYTTDIWIVIRILVIARFGSTAWIRSNN